jgi:hypothetical protein
MNKYIGAVIAIGVLLIGGVGATDGETDGGRLDYFSDLPSFREQSPNSRLLSLGDVDPRRGDSRYDTMLLAQDVNAPVPRSSAPRVSVSADNSGAQVAVRQEFSTWSDLTAVFRPSRWSNPLAVGGSLSWLNYKAWANEPGRTGKVLLGEAIVAGAAYAVYESTRSSGGSGGKDDSGGSTPAPTSSGGSSGGSSTSSSGGGSSTSSSSGGSSTSSSGGSSTSSSSSSGSSTSSSSSSGSSTSSSSSGELPF